MPINFTDFSRAPLLERKNPTDTLFENILKGYQMSQVPKETQQRQQEKELTNKLKTLDLEHKPKEFELSDKEKTLSNSIKEFALKNLPEKTRLENQLTQANINRALRPAVVRGALADTMRLRDSLDPNSPTYKQDLAAVNNRINKLSTGQNGISVSSNPDGGFEINIGGNKEEARNLTGIPNVNKGDVVLADKQGKPYAIGKPWKEAALNEEKGRLAFNVYQPFITNAQAPYSGKGANKAFNEDISNYSTDAAAKQRIDNLLASEKLLFATTVKEDATLGGANTNRVYKDLKEALEISEIFPALKNISKYRLPRGYAKTSSDIYNQILNKGSEQKKNIPAYDIKLLNPNQDNKNSSVNQNSSATMPNQKVRVYNPETGRLE